MKENTAEKNLAIDFCNTIAINHGKIVDTIQTIDKFKDWLLNSYPEFESSINNINELELDQLFIKAKDSRVIMRNILNDIISTSALSEEIVELINNALEEFQIKLSININNNKVTQQLSIRENLVYKFIFDIWISFINLLTQNDLSRIRQCASEECILFFVDTSKGGQRRWCSMKSCGNRDKVTRHLKKRREEENI